MSIGSNVYLTGLGSRGLNIAAADTYLRIFIPGKPGNTLVIDQLHFEGNDSQSTAEYMKVMRVLGRTNVTAAGTAAGTSGFTITTAGFSFGDSTVWGEATDQLAADDIVALHLANGTWEWDMVDDVSTTGKITLDTALTGIATIGDEVYIFGSPDKTAHFSHEIPASGAFVVEEDAGMGDEKGDPLLITNYPASSTGTLAAGIAVLNVQYSYVNK